MMVMGRLESFLRLYPRENTSSTYRWALAEYFKTVDGENKQTVEEKADRYFVENRNFEEDMQNFSSTISRKPPKTVRLMIAAVRSFLIENDVELSEKFWRRLMGRVRGSRALTLDKVPSNVELRRIIAHMPIQGKALYLTLASSGMRTGESLRLQLDDVELDQTPAKIKIKGEYTKTGNSRIAFISREAKEAIEEWLKVRSNYLQAAAAKSKRRSHYKLEFKGKSTEDSSLFPFEDSTSRMIWVNAVNKAGFLKKDSSTNHYTLHPHVLRKFFRTKMGAVIPVDVAEALMGHEGYLTEVYRRYSQEDLAKFYLQGEPALSIFTEAEEVSKLRAEVEEKNKTLQTLVNGLAVENMNLKSRADRTEAENAELKNRMSNITSKFQEEIEKLKQDSKQLYNDTKPLVEFFSRYTPEEWQDLLEQKMIEERIEDDEPRDDDKAEIEEELKKQKIS
jgi:integrase